MSEAHREIQGEGVAANETQHIDRDLIAGERVETSARPESAGKQNAKTEGRGSEERKLDKALADSFPASDPMPASPGSD